MSALESDVAPVSAGAVAALEVRDLRISFGDRSRGFVEAVHGVNLSVARGRTLGIVGESGSGKSITAMALLRLLDPARSRLTGSVLVGGVDILATSERALRGIRGRNVGFVFQDPIGSLDPSMKIGRQLTQPLRLHSVKSDHLARAREMLGLVGITDPDRRLQQYPHELSGGMRQRVMIASALMTRAPLLILDEPTTALDVTTQAQILDLLRELKESMGLSMILISHDLGVVAQVADEVAVMYAGRIVEHGPTAQVLQSPLHRYTAGLLACRPSLTIGRDQELTAIPGVPPSLRDHAATGCSFAPRCVAVIDDCRTHLPPPAAVGHSASCWVPVTATEKELA